MRREQQHLQYELERELDRRLQEETETMADHWSEETWEAHFTKAQQSVILKEELILSAKIVVANICASKRRKTKAERRLIDAVCALCEWELENLDVEETGN